jgi:transposase
LVCDYHQKNSVIRKFHELTREESVSSVATCATAFTRIVEQARQQLPRGGQAVWIMESTTGWARVKRLLIGKVRFVLANVLQMPMPPKARRRKTDKIDTQRLLREYLNGSLPESWQPDIDVRQVRRVCSLRESLVRRRTAVSNWINRYFAHERWDGYPGASTYKGYQALRTLKLDPADRFVVDSKLDELDHLQALLGPVEEEIRKLYDESPQAQALDEINGIDVISAVCILSRIGSVRRFRSAEELISYAGFAPGVQQSDQSVRSSSIGGGGTDKSLRFYILEATVWARKIPRYKALYERVLKRRGKKIARIEVARHLLRSIFRMLRDDVRFDRMPATCVAVN